MRTDGCEVVETLPDPRSFKVHRTMCTELHKLVDRILRILPEIEATRPQSSTGIQSLCSLNSAISKAKQLLQRCSESSKLYLAVTGDSVLSKCQKIGKSLEKSLFQIQGMVPVMLAVKISQIVDDLGCVTFVLDSAEEEAGRVVRELLEQRSSTSDKDSLEISEIKSLQFVAPRLNITSPTTILIEKRSIRKLLDNVGPNDLTKNKNLSRLLDLLMKYPKLITGEQLEKVYAHSEGPITTENSSHHDSQCNHHVESDQCLNYVPYRTHTSKLGGVAPPEEYKCPMSSRLMYDPVVIASGVTYERIWIQKWFEEGNSVCPKTKRTLVHMALTPNIAMKDLISKWCRVNGVSIRDPSRQAEAEDFLSWEASSNSVRSFASSMNDLNLPLDLSNVSHGSLDTSYNSDSSHAKTNRGLNLMLNNSNDNSDKHQSHAEINDRDLMLLSKLPDLRWDAQYQVIEDMRSDYKCNCQAFSSVSSENFIEPIIRFLSTAHELHDIKALRAGTQLLLEFVNNCRNGLTSLSEDACNVLASLLNSEVTGETLAMMEELSKYFDKANSAASSALTSVSKILDSGNKEFQQKAIRIMCNLSSNGEICHQMVSFECIPKLLPFFKDRALLRYCICILKNLCDTEEGRVSFVENKGAVSSVAEILETGSSEEKEHALAILLSLCSQREQYCQLVMYEGVIPSLVDISNHGKDNTKAFALELLRQLRDVDYVGHEDCLEPKLNASQDFNSHSQKKKSSKKSTILKKLSLFSKSSSPASKHER